MSLRRRAIALFALMGVAGLGPAPVGAAEDGEIAATGRYERAAFGYGVLRAQSGEIEAYAMAGAAEGTMLLEPEGAGARAAFVAVCEIEGACTILRPDASLEADDAGSARLRFEDPAYGAIDLRWTPAGSIVRSEGRSFTARVLREEGDPRPGWSVAFEYRMSGAGLEAPVRSGAWQGSVTGTIGDRTLEALSHGSPGAVVAHDVAGRATLEWRS